SDAVYGESFYSAHGRTFGFLGNISAEFFLSDAIALKLGGGYRFARLDRFKYNVEYADEQLANVTVKKGTVAYWQGTYDTFEVDFSGAFVELGLRIYFEPTAWKDND
ncbi:hypothetical protein KJ564_09120, partial [bacterium]|nr:hypothetical protein [bacterium]